MRGGNRGDMRGKGGEIEGSRGGIEERRGERDREGREGESRLKHKQASSYLRNSRSIHPVSINSSEGEASPETQRPKCECRIIAISAAMAVIAQDNIIRKHNPGKISS